MAQTQRIEQSIFGGGCFWCTEAVFKMLAGVKSAVPGYSGGTTKNPTYEEVSGGNTGHVEAISVEFDPKIISYKKLLTVFFASHDPTTLNRQGEKSRGDFARPFENFCERSKTKNPKVVLFRYGNDIGTQYRSVIFYTTEKQKEIAEKFIENLNGQAGGDPVVTEVVPFDVFYPAEDYHKKYFESHKDAPYCQLVINPKLEKVQKEYGELIENIK